MSNNELPNNPSLENLRKQAKGLRNAVHASEPDALAQVREFHPRLPEALKTFSLSDAQLVIARYYGFAAWPALKKHLEVVDQYFWAPPQQLKDDESEPLADRFLRLACLTYLSDPPSRRDKARELLEATPSLSRESIHTASAVGDVTAVREMLTANPRLGGTRGGPNRWQPLLYAAYSRLNSEAEGHSTLEVARTLLRHRADPNAGFLLHGRYLFTALTGVFGEGESGPVHQPEHQYCYQLARMLLEAGADPNDGQTLYNRMFTGGTRHLELLYEFGLGRTSDGPWFKLLGYGSDTPSQMLQQQMGWAAKYGQMERLRWLVEHGVDVNMPDTRLRRAPYELALLNGKAEIAQYLLEHGARPTALSDLDSFAAACFTADADRARSLLAKDATLVDQLGDQRVELLKRAAEEDKRDAVRLMAELGFDVNEVTGTTPLHHAAAGDHVEMIKLLLALGADPLVPDTEHGATALGWARYSGKTTAAQILEQFAPQTPR